MDRVSHPQVIRTWNIERMRGRKVALPKAKRSLKIGRPRGNR
jgi:hypothetical protein